MLRLGALRVLLAAACGFIPPAVMAAEIAYEEILADPDNIPLTVAYAQQRIDAGELQKAAVALERALILNPNYDQARLLYAVVLYRIANFAEAEAELNTLKERELAPSDRAIVDQYLAAIAARNRPWAAHLVVGLGTHFDTNRNNSPASGKIVVLDNIFDASTEAEKDFGFMAFGAGEFSYKLSPVEPERVFVRAALIADDQLGQDQLDLLAFAGAVGGRTTIETYDFETSFGTSVVGLGDEHFLDIYEWALKGERAFTVDLSDGSKLPVRPYLSVGLGYENFIPTNTAPFASEEDGFFGKGLAGVEINFTPRSSLGVELALRRKDAAEDFNSYWRFGFGLTGAFALDENALLRPYADIGVDRYDAPDAFISATKERRDFEYRVGIDLAHRMDPLFALIGVDPKESVLSDIVATVGVSYKDRDSNLENFASDNFRAQLMLAKRINF